MTNFANIHGNLFVNTFRKNEIGIHGDLEKSVFSTWKLTFKRSKVVATEVVSRFREEVPFGDIVTFEGMTICRG